MQKSTASLTTNIEGALKERSKADKGRFLNIAHESLEEFWFYFVFLKNLENCIVAKIIYLLKLTVKLLYSYSKSILNSDS